MEDNGLSFDFSILDVDFVSTEYNRDVLAYTHEISVPVGYVLVRDAGSHVKHDNSTLACKQTI